MTPVDDRDAPVPVRADRSARKEPTGARRQDARSRRSQERLRAALLRLIEDRPFERITLREIALEAGVSYPTVFNHYAGREDLFEDLARDAILDLLEAFRERRQLPDWHPGRDMCRHVQRRPALWRTLLTAGARDAMRAEFIRLGHDLGGDRDLGNGAPIDLVSGLIASGTFEIIAWWLAQPAAADADTVAGLLEALVIEPALNLPRGYFEGASVRDRHAP